MSDSILRFFEDHIKTYDLFSDEEIATITSLAIPRVLTRKEFLLRQGSVCRSHTFVCSGCIRSYRIDDYGCEHILGLSPAGNWISDRTSLVTGNPSHEFIDALEDSTAVEFSVHSFKTLLTEIPNFNEFNNKIIADDCNRSRDRLYMLLSLPAEKRYREFIRTFPSLHESMPIYMIASYLGIARETLARIRKSMTSNFSF